MPSLRFVAGLAICRREAMIGLFQILAHGFPPRFTAQARYRAGLTAQALRIVGSEVAVGALQQFAGVNIPGKTEVLFAGQIEERGLDLLGREYRTGGTGQLVSFQFLERPAGRLRPDNPQVSTPAPPGVSVNPWQLPQLDDGWLGKSGSIRVLTCRSTQEPLNPNLPSRPHNGRKDKLLFFADAPANCARR